MKQKIFLKILLGLTIATYTSCNNKTDDIKTKIPMNRFGKPNEIAETILFLINESTSYITGETISINGGMYMN